MQHTKIEWVRNPDGSPGYSWNPIKGLCPVGCKTPDGKSYCYARKVYQRFHREFALSWDGKTPLWSHLKPSRIFVCSTIEIFHPQIPRLWRNDIFQIIEFLHNRKHTFIILTKMPQRIDRPMPDNVWLGVSVTGRNQDDDRIRFLCSAAEARLKFVSFEPLLEDVACTWNAFPDYITCFSWVIVGRLTGHGRIHDPTAANIGRIVERCQEAGIPIFLKNNLREIWKRRLIQEWPSEKVSDVN